MSSFITLLSLFGMLMLPSFCNILAYPVSHKISLKISDYIVKVMAPRLFAVLECYKHFHFFGDIPCYMNFLRDKELRFVAKDNLSRHIPLVSEMLRSQKHCMVPRSGSPMLAMKTMETFSKRVTENGWIPVLFPEGTRTRDGNVGKFYSAGFRKLCETTNLPVVVCALDGGYQIREIRTIMTNLKNGSYRVKILKIYDAPSTKEEQALILEESRKMIQNQLDEWRKLPLNQR